MLDEFLEFKEYTCKLDKDMSRRFHYSNIMEMNGGKGVFGSVPRALMIISRYAYYHAGLNEEIKTDATIHVLKLWCGFEDDTEKYGIKDIPEFSNIRSWLPEYINTVESSVGKDNKEELIDDLNDRCKKNWCRSALDQESGTVNDQNSIYFEKIIAEAIAEGELRKQCLCFDKDPLRGFTFKEDKISEKEDKKTGKREAVLYDEGLKLVAACLINQIPESEYASVDFATYSNWVKKGCTSKKHVTSRTIKKIEYKFGNEEDEKTGKRIIECEYMDYSDPGHPRGPMLKLNTDWIKEYRPELIAYEEDDELSKLDKRFVFADRGCGAPLEKIR